MSPIRVLLVDDQQLVRSGFSLILSVEDGIEVVGEAANGSDAITLARARRPDVVLMDVQMPVMDGIEATRAIVAQDLAKVVILTTFDRDDYVFAGLRAGASGFLLKNAEPEQLVDAVRSVAEGHALLAPEVTRRVIERLAAGSEGAVPGSGQGEGMGDGRGAGQGDGRGDGQGAVASGRPAREPADARLEALTRREREVLELVGHGLSNAEIAARLYLGEATVKTHLSNVFAKLHLRDRVQAVILAYEVGLVLPGTD